MNSTESPEEQLASFREIAQFEGKTERILPDEVLAAFSKLGGKPEQHIFICDGKRCGLTIVIEARGFVLSSNFEISRLASYMKLSSLYTCGFMWGWDTVGEYWMDTKIREVAPNWAPGANDGRAAWKACRHLAWHDTCRKPPKEEGGTE